MYYILVGNGDVVTMSFWTKIGLPDKQTVVGLQLEIKQLREENKEISEQNRKLLEILINEKTSDFNALVNVKEEKRKNETCLLVDTMDRKLLAITKMISELKLTVSDKVEDLNKNINENNLRAIEAATQSVLDQILDNKEIIRFNSNKIDACCVLIEEKASDIIEKCSIMNNENNNMITRKVSEYLSEVVELLTSLQDDVRKSKSDAEYGIQMIEDRFSQVNHIIHELSDVIAKETDLDSVSSEVEMLSESLRNMWTIMKAIWVDAVLTEVDKIL